HEALKDPCFDQDLGESVTLHTAKDTAAKVIILSLGDEQEKSSENLRRAFGQVAKQIKKSKHVCFDLSGLEVAPALEGFLLGTYKFEMYLSKKSDKVEKLSLLGVANKEQDLIADTQKICEEVYYVRDLVNNPDHTITPNFLADEAKKLAKEFKSISVTDFSAKQVEKMGMGAIIAVGRGSVHEPHLVVLEYKPASAKNKKPIVVVGKGITFDTGGLNLKPTGHIETMKQDMAGAATSLALMKLMARLRVPVYTVVVLPLAENAISDRATKPGSIISAYNGKTIEITHTDAEGRLILADALAYAEKKYKPEYMLDVATLTGAALVTLGRDITAVMGNSESFVETYLKAAKEVGEKAWPLPIDEDYAKSVKGSISDLINLSRNEKAGAIMGAAFLREFIGKTKNWIHLDIAGTAWAEKNSHYRQEGGTGDPLRTLLKLVQKL
ncbi:MAG: leucyl aminopeptidase, partial [Candidatus Gracilibacteria bacterium]|nr:leucyl aminopeptidase [Candidatus Gracilibacteria bacterium]